MTVVTDTNPGSLVFTTGGDQTWVIAPNVEVGELLGQYSGFVLMNYGTVYRNINSNAVWLTADGNFINEPGGVVKTTSTDGTFPGVRIDASSSVTNQGTILSNNHGVTITGSFANNDSIVNSGHLYAALNAIWVSAPSATNVTISNSGDIWGDANGIHMQFGVGAAPAIFNSGVIGARFSSIVASDGDRLNVTNTGTLQGNVVGLSANMADSVTNNGRIVGDVKLGSGIDTYRGTGTVSGIVFGEDGNDTLTGGNSADRLNGGNNSDHLSGGLGNDSLTGAANNDFFIFNKAPNSVSNHDTVTDFVHGLDKFQMENAVFNTLGNAGALNPAFFFAGTAAHDANDHLVYNQASGALYYDSNANAAGGSVLVAVLGTKPVLTAGDFTVI